MIPLSLRALAARIPGIGYVGALVAGILVAATFATCHHHEDAHALTKAHAVSLAKVDTVRRDSIVYVHDTVTARQKVVVYQAARDTALAHPTDTAAVRVGFAACDSAIAGLYTALSSADRLIQAHRRYEYALQTELAASERLRAPRYSVTTRAGVEWGTLVPLTELESTVRITHDWSVGGRISKRWAAGEPTRRYLMASRTF